MKDYPIIKRIREILISDKFDSEPEFYDVVCAILTGLPSWPELDVDGENEKVDCENFAFYKIEPNEIVLSCGGDWQKGLMVKVYLENGEYKSEIIDPPQYDIPRLSLDDELLEVFIPSEQERNAVIPEPIEIRHFANPMVRLYNAQNSLVGTIYNELQFNDIRIQIKTKQLSGYYVYWRDEKININKDGKLDKASDGLYDQANKQRQELEK